MLNAATSAAAPSWIFFIDSLRLIFRISSASVGPQKRIRRQRPPMRSKFGRNLARFSGESRLSNATLGREVQTTFGPANAMRFNGFSAVGIVREGNAGPACAASSVCSAGQAQIGADFVEQN